MYGLRIQQLKKTVNENIIFKNTFKLLAFGKITVRLLKSYIYIIFKKNTYYLQFENINYSTPFFFFSFKWNTFCNFFVNPLFACQNCWGQSNYKEKLYIYIFYTFFLYIYIQQSVKSTTKFAELNMSLINSNVNLKIKCSRDMLGRILVSSGTRPNPISQAHWVHPTRVADPDTL